MTEPSGSSQIYNYLRANEKHYTNNSFTSGHLKRKLPHLTQGQITGFLTKGVKREAINIIDNTTKFYKYILIDLNSIQDHIRSSSSIGSKPGRIQLNHTPNIVVNLEPKEETLDSILIDFANNIEVSLNTCLGMFKDELKNICDSTAERVNTYKHSIMTVSEDSLLNELKRRIHERDV